MLHNAIVQKVADQVRAIMTGEGSGHDWEHVQRVWHVALQLAKAEGVNADEVSLMVLIHDLDDAKLTGDPSTEITQPLARKVLAEAGVDAAQIEDICQGVKTTGYRKALAGVWPTVPAAQILSDADFLDAIGQIGIARVMTYGGHKGRPIFVRGTAPAGAMTEHEYLTGQSTGIHHFFDKLLKLRDMMFTAAGKQEAEIRHQRMVRFLDEFFAEVGAEEVWLRALDAYR